MNEITFYMKAVPYYIARKVECEIGPLSIDLISLRASSKRANSIIPIKVTRFSGSFLPFLKDLSFVGVSSQSFLRIW